VSDASDSLPPPDPVAGPVPLPRHRPSVLALVEIGTVPVPRVRPADAAEPAPSPTTYLSGYDPAMGHY
jgi:hypothetical protein